MTFSNYVPGRPCPDGCGMDVPTRECGDTPDDGIRHEAALYEVRHQNSPLTWTEHHLHFLSMRGQWEWVLRTGTSKCCGTPRCIRITVLPR